MSRRAPDGIPTRRDILPLDPGKASGWRNSWPRGAPGSLRGVSELAVTLTDAPTGPLTPLGLNNLRTFDIHGNVAWGARPLEGADAQASQWKYIPVRRLALHIEESLFRGRRSLYVVVGSHDGRGKNQWNAPGVGVPGALRHARHHRERVGFRGRGLLRRRGASMHRDRWRLALRRLRSPAEHARTYRPR